MIREIFDIGDVVGYPFLKDANRDRQMTVLDRKFFYYKNSKKLFVRYLFGHELMEHIVEDMHRNVDNDFNNIILIEGPTGSGKSHLAYQLCKAYDPNFNIEEGYVYTYTDLLDKIDVHEGKDMGKTYWLDEGGNMLSNRNSMSSENRGMITLFDTMRSRGWTVIICTPDAERVDKGLREYHIRYLFRAVITDWDERGEHKRGYYEFLRKRGKGLQGFKTAAYGMFDEIPEDDLKIYKRLKKKSQERILMKMSGKKDPEEQSKQPKINKIEERMRTRVCVSLANLHDNKHMTYDELAKEFNYDVETVRGMAKKGRELFSAQTDSEDGA